MPWGSVLRHDEYLLVVGIKLGDISPFIAYVSVKKRCRWWWSNGYRCASRLIQRLLFIMSQGRKGKCTSGSWLNFSLFSPDLKAFQYGGSDACLMDAIAAFCATLQPQRARGCFNITAQSSRVLAHASHVSRQEDKSHRSCSPSLAAHLQQQLLQHTADKKNGLISTVETKKKDDLTNWIKGEGVNRSTLLYA